MTTNPVAIWSLPINTTDNATVYKGKLDGNFAVAQRIVDNFAPRQSTVPAMTVSLDPGHFYTGTTLTEVATQTTGTITAPVSHPRIDRVVVDTTGTIAVITGTPASSPVAPAFTVGVFPVAQVLLQTTSTSITDSMITDERELIGLNSSSAFTTGDTKETYKVTADIGWVMANDGTIGSASSGATTRANADTAALFALFWNNCTNTACPVSGGRGANAAADFAANKTINLPLRLGRSPLTSGAGSGLTNYALGQTDGANTSTALISHTHTASVTDSGHAHTAANWLILAGGSGSNTAAYLANTDPVGNISSNPQTSTATTGISVSNSTAGSGSSYSIMGPISGANLMIKL